ncbi:hypothetical protein SAMN05443574_103325 [Haloarcula vallismortis]|uniref:DNA replication initiation complex subunit n=2 Tax=Haloarcula vallismortis TaxID=28442 RepID=M0JR34_HALVA|nr:hypothetical protein [Haloarcula vallismortis]EMA11587.1 DNA replication initiation complex subunit [Haloarcula vallismortis ATCC 29715]SDW45598.1 hypothetical protein SAMN05443574_103325 [Haloarcula vallismortis]
MGIIVDDELHGIVSEQEMNVEREWVFQKGDLQQVESTVTSPASDEIFRCRCGETFDSKEAAETHIAEIEAEKEEQEGEADTGHGYERVEFLTECPEFMGTDLEVYGPFDEGDTAEVPEDNAEILVNRGNAERTE